MERSWLHVGHIYFYIIINKMLELMKQMDNSSIGPTNMRLDPLLNREVEMQRLETNQDAQAENLRLNIGESGKNGSDPPQP